MKPTDDDDTFIGDLPRPPMSHGTGHGDSSNHDDDHETDDHVDERWLVSYADMMTLLFGLFVLLYSMANLDKAAAQKIVESTQEKFGSPDTKLKPEETIDPKMLKEKLLQLETQNQTLHQAVKKLEDLKIQAETEQQDIVDKKNDLEEELNQLKKTLEITQKSAALNSKNKNEQTLRDQQQQENLRIATNNLHELQNKMSQREKELTTKISRQQEDIANMQLQLQRTQRAVASTDPKDLEKLQKETTNLQKKNQLIAEKLDAAQEKNDQLTDLIKNLQSKAKDGQGDTSSQAFLAVFINWSTKDHDIDLVIKDPNNNTFDFKKRKYASAPGFFALDTRRGPGAELWQSDRIIPGKYTATYSFYNQYGNKETAKVSGTIYSPKGSFEIRPIEMDITNKKKYEIFFEVNSDGEVKILNTR